MIVPKGEIWGCVWGYLGRRQDLRDAVPGHGGQSVAEQYGRGVALGRMMQALCSAFRQLDA